MNITEPRMDVAASRFWSTLISALALLGAGFAAYISLVQYFDTREKEQKTFDLQVQTARIEAKKPFYAKYLDLCTEATNAAAIIASTSDSKKRAAGESDFWRLYWGQLAIVEDPQVESAMVVFGRCLHGECDKDKEFLALDIAHSCRNGISAKWDLTLEALPARQPH